jgi:sugar lactone lactonase YvrE
MPPRVTAVRPHQAIEGGRITIDGSGFPVDEPVLPEVRVGERASRIVYASPSRLEIVVPAGLDSGRAHVRVSSPTAGASSDPRQLTLEDEIAFVEVAAPFATGLHQVDNPVFDADGNLYLTFSGTRGQQVPVSVFRVRPNGTREPFSSAIVNPTSMAIDPDGLLYVSSRFEGTVYRLREDGSAEPFARELGVACGLAFDEDGTLFVGDRSGTIFRVNRKGHADVIATLPPSIAAFHVAMGPDHALYVTGPTLSSHDPLYRVSLDGDVTERATGFGRPQGVAFDPSGALYVVDALTAANGLYRVPDEGRPVLELAGTGLVGVAFDGAGGLAVCSNDTAYRLFGRARTQRLQ